MLQRDGVVMMEMKVLVMRMMVMMIPMNSGAMIVGTLAYHPGFPLCIQFTIPGDRREPT
jgi:hypothetical protein